MAVRQRDRRVDFQTATQGKLTGLKDPEVLGVAAAQNRILVTHDRRTIPRHFRNRIESGENSPGVFIVSQFEPIGPVVEALLLIWAASDARDWENQIRHLPSLAAHVFAR
ncbi:MAG: DUF5615 family PIN-like protein [Bryobacterales bacterium]|nr:DUF5615 family PIN-like protein [Bryobacterales bacterium]